MTRSLACLAAVTILLTVCPAALAAGLQNVIATHCEESQVISSQHTTSRLGRCDDSEPQNLLWHLDRIDQVGGALDGRFTRRTLGAGVTVYVMDTGVMAAHDEFANADGTSQVVAGYDEALSVPLGGSKCRSANRASAPCFSDEAEFKSASHGTAVASLIAGKNVGVAPAAQIVSVRVMNEHGLATTRTYLDGLNAIIRHAWTLQSSATQIVNISGWVLDRLYRDVDPDSVVPYATVEARMRTMIGGVDAEGRPDPAGRKFLFVVAANNVDGGCGASGTIDRFPAILGAKVDGIITVGGMTAENASWGGSCRGGVEVLAPAQNVFSATISARDEYRGKGQRSGTSFAAPIISGIAALLIAEHPTMSPEEVEAWIKSTPSRVVNPDTRLADGRVAISMPAESRDVFGIADAAAGAPTAGLR